MLIIGLSQFTSNHPLSSTSNKNEAAPQGKKTSGGKKNPAMESGKKKNVNSRSKKIFSLEGCVADEKQNISGNKRTQRLQQLKKVNQLIDANAIVPFASVSNILTSFPKPIFQGTKGNSKTQNRKSCNDPGSGVKQMRIQEIIRKRIQYHKKMNSNKIQRQKTITSHMLISQISFEPTESSSIQKRKVSKSVNYSSLRRQKQNSSLIKNNFQHRVIQQSMIKQTVNNRQKSCHSFLVRKKVSSTRLGNNDNSEKNATARENKNYRKDRFIKEDITSRDSAQIKQSEGLLQHQLICHENIFELKTSEASAKLSRKLKIDLLKSTKLRKNKHMKLNKLMDIYQTPSQPNQCQQVKEPDLLKEQTQQKKPFEQIKNENKADGFSSNRQLTKNNDKKIKPIGCLTHKIKWGKQRRKKSASEKGLQVFFPLDSNSEKQNNMILLQKLKANQVPQMYQQSQRLLDNRIGQKHGCLKRDFESRNKESEEKNRKKIRFLDLEMIQLREKISIKNRENLDCAYKKIDKIQKQQEQVSKGSKIQSISEYEQIIQSRSLIVFEDPGISAIVKKSSQAYDEKSPQRKFTTIQRQVDFQQHNVQKTSKFKQQLHSRHQIRTKTRLQSLRELFLQLKSRQSIQLEEDQISISQN